jgi:hypothetical protein
MKELMGTVCHEKQYCLLDSETLPENLKYPYVVLSGNERLLIYFHQNSS